MLPLPDPVAASMGRAIVLLRRLSIFSDRIGLAALLENFSDIREFGFHKAEIDLYGVNACLFHAGPTYSEWKRTVNWTEVPRRLRIPAPPYLSGRRKV
jgi:hypothetical protein